MRCLLLIFLLHASVSTTHAWGTPRSLFVLQRCLGSSSTAPRRSTATTTPTTTTTTTLSSAPTDKAYYTVMETPVQTQSSSRARSITLTRYLDDLVKENPDLRQLESILLAIQMACKTISNLVHRAGLVYSIANDSNVNANNHSNTTTTTTTTTRRQDFTDGRFYSMQRLDQLSTMVLQNALKYTGKLKVVTPVSHVSGECAQHQPGVLIAQALDSNYVACLDPLDGSGNADASICTGTVFGVFENPDKKEITSNSASDDDATATSTPPTDAEQTQALVESVLQPAKNMRAAGYCLYSSATVLVFTLGDTVQGFTLDPQINEFVLTHPNLTIPARGSVYSCNEGNSEGWDESYKTYLRKLKTGKGDTGQRYAHRYVGSMVGDIHRTLLYGGIFAYPADSLSHPDGNLQLLYKSAPMAFVVHHAGGKAIDGRTGSLLEVQPERVHQKSPCFMGSPEDVAELERYLAKSVSEVTSR